MAEDQLQTAQRTRRDPSAGAADELLVGVDQLGQARHRVFAGARRAGLDETAANDIVLAVNELLTNSIQHGGGEARLEIDANASGIRCTVHDRGSGRYPRPPPRPCARQGGGWGLWLVVDLCDLVQVRSGPEGTVVRVEIRRNPSARRAPRIAS